ncbi:MAG TPA: hypothetical protein VKA26_08210 [Ignavibacteriaceae bacterium]|nr:hypothetical protein [Ignavibacteriaceae bacterium]
MKLITAYKNGFISAFKTKKLATTIYAITFLLALAIAIPFKGTIMKEAGSSMAFEKLLKGYDYTVYTDFMHNSYAAIQPYISIAIWMGIFYLIFTIFFSGGILTILKNGEEKYSLRSFWEGSARYFSRFFRLALYMLIFQIFIAVIYYIALFAILGSAYHSVKSEASLFYMGLIGIIIHLFIFILLLIVTDYAKVMMVEHEEYRPFRTILRAFGFSFRHFLSAYLLYILLLVVPLILFIIYFKLEDIIGMSSGLTILIVFILQQLFIWSRIYIKIWILGSELNLYRNFDTEVNINIDAVPAFEG